MDLAFAGIVVEICLYVLMIKCKDDNLSPRPWLSGKTNVPLRGGTVVPDDDMRGLINMRLNTSQASGR
jgi:hypothetical protein